MSDAGRVGRALRFEVVDTLSWAATSTPNEDLIHAGAQALWILDGATSSRAGGAADVQRLIATGNAVLCEELEDASERPDLRLAVELAIRAARRELSSGSADNAEQPSASLGICRLVGRSMECFRLGDVTMAVVDASSVTVVADPQAVAKERRLLRAGGTTEAAMLDELGRRRRRSMNRPGGYWIFGTEPAAAHHGELKSIPVRAGSTIVLASDGFARLVDVFGLYPDWPSLVRHALDRGLSALAEQLRKAEQRDPRRERFPRAKVHDDASAILAEVVET